MNVPLLLLLLIMPRVSHQQSAEPEELQRLCPSLRGVFCSHCNHKSVEQICPYQCRFCVAFRGPQNLGTLKRQCALLGGINCALCKTPSISELCVDECLACENGLSDLLGQSSGEVALPPNEQLFTDDSNDPNGLFDIFRQLQKMELEEQMRRNGRNRLAEEDIGAEAVEQEGGEEDGGLLLQELPPFT